MKKIPTIPENVCPVCGYEMEAPPRDYRICPSCGTEFGVHDVNASIADLRESWMKSGPRWWSRTDVQPADWNPIEQMESAGILVKRPQATDTTAVSTSSSSVLVGGRDCWVASGSVQPGGTPRVVVFD